MTARPAFAPWDVRTATRILDAAEAARRARAFAAIEERLARLLADSAGTLDSDHGQAILARHAKHHEWHRVLLLQVLGGSDDADAPSGEPDDLAAFLEAVAAPTGAEQAIEFLTGVYRVLLPRKIAAYTYFVRALGGDAADADARWFDRILQDELEGIRDGELLLQSLLDGPDAVQRSADRRAELETLLVASGGLLGPDTLGAVTQAHPDKTEIVR